jgi:ERCC4-type nuclease
MVNPVPQPAPVLACTRPDGPIACLLRERGIEVTLLPLEVDWRPLPDRYLLGEGRIAERFTTAQFGRAIVRKTLFLTALDLRAQDGEPIFVIEGADFHEYGSLHPNAVRGALSALVIEYGGSVLRTSDPEDTAELLTMMARHAQFGVPEISLAAKRKADSPADEQRRVIEMLPGVGFSLARRLLQRFGSIRRILAASPEDLAQVRGLSVQRAEVVLEVIHREYCAVDFEEEIEHMLAEQPTLLFDEPVSLVARQHVFSDAEGRRLIADLVFADDAQEIVFVVEVKRGAVQRDDVRQLSAYLDAADRSPLLGDYMRRGYGLQGVLAAPDSRIRTTEDDRVGVRQIDAEEIAGELMRRRQGSE